MRTDEKEQGNLPDKLMVDPEPMSVFLGVLGFIGSIASIIGYIEVRKQQHRDALANRNKMLLEARDLLLSLEVDTMQTETSLRKLEVLLLQGTSGNVAPSLARIRFEFGAARPLFTLHGFEQFEDTMQELNRLVGKSFTTTSRLLQKLYNLDLRFDPSVHKKLIELQGRLNSVMREPCTYEEAFRVHYEIVGYTQAILRDVRGVISKELGGEVLV